MENYWHRLESEVTKKYPHATSDYIEAITQIMHSKGLSLADAVDDYNEYFRFIKY